MSNSKLVDVKMLSPNCTKNRNHKIDTITIHCVVGQLTAYQIGHLFLDPDYQASSNYGVGVDCKIGLYVDENDRSWCSSSPSNDHRAITIEVASDREHPYYVHDDVLEKLIELLVDICKRNNIPKLLWKADKSLIGNIKKQNMTVHRWFKNKDCPGEYLYNLHYKIAEIVNEKLEENSKIKVGDKVKVLNPVTYDGKKFKVWYNEYDVLQVKNDRVVIGIKDVITAPIHIKNIKKA